MISIILCTSGRESISITISSILKNTYKNIELIVVHQGHITKHFESKIIRYIQTSTQGLSRARNIGIKHSHGEIIAFTDDDCIVDEYWLQNVHDSFKTHRSICGVFGRVLPYEPNLHEGMHCPCCVDRNSIHLIQSPGYHGDVIGYGNNMAFRSEVFTQFGYFKEWLGSGSIGGSAEDAEFSLRLLLKKQVFLYQPNTIVYHNKWLSPETYYSQMKFYDLGEIACYAYFWIQGYSFAGPIILQHFMIIPYIFRKLIQPSHTNLKKQFSEILRVASYLIKGFSIAGYYSVRDPILIDH